VFATSGYTLTGGPTEKLFVVLLGDGNNGKTTFMNGLHKLLSSYSKTVDKSLFFSEDEFDLNQLKDKRMILMAEHATFDQLNESRMKELTGGDDIYHEDGYFKLSCVPFLVTDSSPQTSGTDLAILHRIFIFKIPAKFCDNPIQPHERKRKLEMSQIWEQEEYLQELLNWAVQGAIEYHREGLKIPPSVVNDNETYRQNQIVTC